MTGLGSLPDVRAWSRAILLALLAVGGIQGFGQSSQFAKTTDVLAVNNEESSWSPNGKLLAFDSTRGGKHYNLYALELSSGNISRLTESDADDITPAYSPDGRHIAFSSDRTGHNQIWMIDADGKNLRRVSHSESDDIHPSWSPDGKLVIFCSARDNPNQATAAEGERYEIYTVHPDGAGETRLTNLGGINTYPNFSPDGKKIAFRKLLPPKNSEVWVMNADGSDAKNLTNHPAFDGWPYWSPDGSRIVFASNREGTYDIFTMNKEGGDVIRLTDQKARCTSPKWSPDDRKISFDCSRDNRVTVLMIDVK